MKPTAKTTLCVFLIFILTLASSQAIFSQELSRPEQAVSLSDSKVSPSDSDISLSESEAFQPFECTIDTLRVEDSRHEELRGFEKVTVDEMERRLILGYSITNHSGLDFHDVWYKIEFNEEASPFFETGIMPFESEHMDVTNMEKALTDSSKDTKVSGFEGEHDIILTPEDTLIEFDNLHQDQLFDYLKELIITIHWDGGEQQTILPITDPAVKTK